MRAGLGLALLWGVWRLVFRSDLSDLSNPTFWAFAALLLWLFPTVVNIGFGLTWSHWLPRTGVIAAAVITSAIGLAASGGSAGPATWWFVRLWMIYVAGHLGFSFVLAAVLGTPGCEMRAIPHLVGLITGRRRAEHDCPAFLDNLDRWEVNRHVTP